MKDGSQNWLSSKRVGVNLFALLFLCLSSTVSAQTPADTCLKQARHLAKTDESGAYRSLLPCALEVVKSAKDTAYIYYLIGRSRFYTHREEAQTLLDTAIFIAHPADETVGKAWHFKAYLYNLQSDYIRAEKAYQNAFQHYKRYNGSSKNIGNAAKDLGNIYTRLSDYEKAIGYIQQAVDHFREIENYPKLAQAMADLTKAYFTQGKIAEARDQAASVLRVPLITDLERGLAKSIIGDCLAEQKNYPASIITLKEAIALFEKAEEPAAAMQCHVSLGDIYLKQGELSAAKSSYQAAATCRDEAFGNRQSREIGQWHIGWANVLIQQQKWDEALRAFQQALFHCLPAVIDTLAVAQNFSPDHIYKENVLIQALEGKAKCWIEKYKVTPDESYLNLAIDALDLLYATEDKFRKSYDFESSRLKVGALRHPRVELSLWAISRLTGTEKRAEQAFAYVESSKALGLLEELKNDQSRQSVLPEATAFQWNVQEKEIQEVEAELGKNPLDSLKSHLEELRSQHATFIKSLEKLYPEYYQFKYNYETIKPEQLQASLTDEQTFIEYFYGDKAIYAFKVSVAGLEFFELVHPDSLSAALKTLERSLRSGDLQSVSPAQYAQAANHLYQHLLAPLGELSARLTIVPDRALARIPFDALIAQQPDAPKTWRELHYLIRDKSIAYAWSATLLNIQQETAFTRKGVLSISPVHYQQLPHLTAGETMGPHLQSLWSDTKLLEEASATKANFLQQLQNTKQPYQILNLYTHAKADSLSPGQSWISFRDDQPDAFLYLNELYHLQLNAQLAVLGACETGIGKEYRGEGLMSFARGFTYAGCQSILSTLWSSDEQATAGLLQSFFSKLKTGASKDMALADSKRDFLAASSERTAMEYHPRLWASLMVIGDSQAMGSGGFAWWWGLVVLLALGLLAWRIISAKRP